MSDFILIVTFKVSRNFHQYCVVPNVTSMCYFTRDLLGKLMYLERLRLFRGPQFTVQNGTIIFTIRVPFFLLMAAVM